MRVWVGAAALALQPGPATVRRPTADPKPRAPPFSQAAAKTARQTTPHINDGARRRVARRRVARRRLVSCCLHRRAADSRPSSRHTPLTHPPHALPPIPIPPRHTQQVRWPRQGPPTAQPRRPALPQQGPVSVERRLSKRARARRPGALDALTPFTPTTHTHTPGTRASSPTAGSTATASTSGRTARESSLA